MHPRFLLPALALLALAACKGGGSGSDAAQACSPQAVKADVLSLARANYLYDEDLPPVVDLQAYASPSILLAALTAKARQEGKDRGWSNLTTLAEQKAYFDEGQTLGLGFQGIVEGNGVYITEAIPGGPGAAAGLGRGDELLAVAATPAGLDDPANQVAALLADGTLGDSVQVTAAGQSRALRLRKAQGATVDVTVTASVYGLDPVPRAASPIVLTNADGRKVGYLALRTFIGPASDLLRTAAGNLAAAGVTDLIVDLRYNGGGQVDVAEVLANLLRAGHAGDLMYQESLNGQAPAQPPPVRFGNEPNALAPARIAFIVTGATASASELVINVLQPYYGTSLALVGSQTYGKPVGTMAISNPTCGWVLNLVALQFLNAAGTGGYFQGLPDANFKGVTIPALDDLTHAPGSPDESCTAAALAWIDTGVVPAAQAAASLRRPSTPLQSTRPTLPQRHLPGLF